MTQLQRFQTALSKSEFDAALISSGVNQRYLSDLCYDDGYVLVSSDKAFLLADFRYIEVARATVKNMTVILPESTMAECLFQLMRDNGYINIAIEEDDLSCSTLKRLTEKLPRECKLLHGASRLLEAQRTVKLPYEIERMKAAQAITDKAFEHILSFIKPEVTELDVALELEFFMRRNGAESVAFNTIAVSGSASSLPHGVPSSVKLRRGFLTMDFGARYDGYCSDMTRTVVIGKADGDIKKIYEIVLSAQKNAIEHIRGGMLCREADALARDIIKAAGYGEAFGHSLGHGIGMNVHESPRLSEKTDEASRLEAGHVFSIEPGIYLEGKYGCRIEDMAMINADGSLTDLTASPKELIEL